MEVREVVDDLFASLTPQGVQSGFFPLMFTLPVIDLDHQCLTLLKHLLIETLGGKDKRKIS